MNKRKLDFSNLTYDDLLNFGVSKMIMNADLWGFDRESERCALEGSPIEVFTKVQFGDYISLTCNCCGHMELLDLKNCLNRRRGRG